MATEQQRVIAAQQQHERWLQRRERGRARAARREQEAQRRKDAAQRRTAQWEASGGQSLLDQWRAQGPDADLSELRRLIEEQAKDAARTQIRSPVGVWDNVALEVSEVEKEWWDPTFDAYVRLEEERSAALEWELETLNRGHGYDSRDPVPYGREVMERDKPAQEHIARSSLGGRMHTEHKRSHSPRAKQLDQRGNGAGGITRRSRD